jgi:hypothetical protein
VGFLEAPSKNRFQREILVPPLLPKKVTRFRNCATDYRIQSFTGSFGTRSQSLSMGRHGGNPLQICGNALPLLDLLDPQRIWSGTTWTDESIAMGAEIAPRFTHCSHGAHGQKHEALAPRQELIGLSPITP